MNNLTSSSHANVPAIHVQDADDSPHFHSVNINSNLFDMYNMLLSEDDSTVFHCSQDPQSDFSLSLKDSIPPELEEIAELSHLTATLPTEQQYLTGHHYSTPFSDSPFLPCGSIPPYTDGGLSPSTFGSSDPSPSSSFTSLSPVSVYNIFPETESPVSPSFHASGYPYAFPPSSPSDDSFPPISQSAPSGCSISPGVFEGEIGPQRYRSSPNKVRTVASPAMLDANIRRRRHPAQYVCDDCHQTFTAQFSLKRHQQSHTGERPFQCSIPGCGQRFFNSSDCKRHEKSRKRHKDLAIH